MKPPASTRALLLAGALALFVGGCDLITSSVDPPSTPANLRASGVSTTAIELTWSEDSESVEKIEIEKDDDSGAFSALATVDAGVGTYRDEGLSPGTAFRYRIRACNEGGCSNYTAAIRGRTFGLLGVVTVSLPDGVEGEPYAAVTLEATGGDGPYAWTVTGGSLPDGLSLTADGTLSGTPTETGAFDVTVQVTSDDGQTAGRELSLEVFPPLQITTTSLPDATVGEVYTQGLAATGGDGSYGWQVSSGSLPGGLALSGNGIISGTPGSLDIAQFSVQVTSGDGQTASRELTLTVKGTGGGTTVVVLSSLLAPVAVGGDYDRTLEAIGGDGENYAWSVASGSLPAGLTLESSGRLHGTPTTPGTSDFTVRVTSGGEEGTADLTLEVVPNNTGAYDITSLNVAPVDPAIQTHVDAALARWEVVVTADLSGVTVPADLFPSSQCGGFGDVVNGTSMDDLLVFVNIAAIDGVGSTLAQAGPCVVRGDADALPAAGILTLDSDDLDPLVGTETLTSLIAHELGHVLGFGTRWDRQDDSKDLITGVGGLTPLYIGKEGMARYESLGGTTGGVPVEEGGGAGTAYAHWDEDEFDTELMTGFSEQVGTSQPLSVVSIGSMQDLGYTVDFTVADPYALPGTALRAGTAAREGSPGYDVIYAGPVGVLPPDAGGFR